MSNQPEWECIGQLGDANPVDHGGFWVFRDKTGVYCEECEYLDSPPEENGEYIAYRFSIKRCTFINGVLSGNQYHPEHCAWFATTADMMKARPQDGKGLTDIASCMDCEESELVRMFCSENPIERAQAYRMVGEYHGFENLDHDPLTMNRRSAYKRYNAVKYRIVE